MNIDILNPDFNELENAFNKIGVCIRDAYGNFKNLNQILLELSVKLDASINITKNKLLIRL